MLFYIVNKLPAYIFKGNLKKLLDIEFIYKDNMKALNIAGCRQIKVADEALQKNAAVAAEKF